MMMTMDFLYDKEECSYRELRMYKDAVAEDEWNWLRGKDSVGEYGSYRCSTDVADDCHSNRTKDRMLAIVRHFDNTWVPYNP